MARNQELLTPPQGTWVEMTNGDVTEITFQVRNGKIEIRGTVGTAAPTQDWGFIYDEREGHLNIPLSTLFKAAEINRVWLRAVEFQSSVVVDHA